MKYVEFVQVIYAAIAEAIRSGDSRARNIGVNPDEVLRSTDCDAPAGEHALMWALLDLTDIGMLDGDKLNVKLGATGRQIGTLGLSDTLWPALFKQAKIEDADREFLAKAVELSEQRFLNCASTRHITAAEMMTALGREVDVLDMVGAFKRLKDGPIELIMGIAALDGTIDFRVRYAGVVLATEQVQSELVDLVDGLLDDWETVTVEIKREVHLKTKEQKAEFVKDVLAIANTKATGSRFILIGWDPKTRIFTSSVDASLTQDRMEQILGAYLDPVPGVKYRTFEWKSGKAGLIEVARRAWEVPYRVKVAIGRLGVGAVRVRHGTQIEEPSDAELQALVEEGTRARAEGHTS
jgi:hypothetical protein